MVPAGNKAKRLSSVNHTIKAIQFNSYIIERCKASNFRKIRQDMPNLFFPVSQ